MQVKIYSVNASNRNWRDWLTISNDANPTADSVGSRELYGTDGRFLCLIHKGGPVRAAFYEQAWKALGDALRDRVWWLFYSGGGYPHVDSSHPNIHYLKYEVVDQAQVPPAVGACFSRLEKRLKEAAEIDSLKLWDLLYPADNVAAASLLALLSAGDLLDISLGAESLSSRFPELNAAYLQYRSRLHEAGSKHARTFHSWLDDFNQRNYNAVRGDLEQALGAVPD